MNQDHQTQGDFLKFLRRRSGKTASEIAKEIGISRSYVGTWEQNERVCPTDPEIIQKLSSGL